MKKAIVIIISVLYYSTAYSQLSKGNFLIGMSTTLSSIGTGPEMFGTGYSTINSKIGGKTEGQTKTFGLNLVPKVGYFVLDNVAVGLDINLSYSSMKINNSRESQTTFFGGLGAFGRYYIPVSKVYSFFELNAGMGQASSKYKSPGSNPYYYYADSESKSNFYNFGTGVGLAVPLGKKIIIDFIAGYDYVREVSNKTYYGQKVGTAIHSFGFEMGIMVMLGGNKQAKKD
ncbi:MAG: hypothetical protein A2W85_14810 [Bacteroidetes bacterium GWF2_41_31]|nr:MAG: hypothetical protein A2W85_14810 [Bacteroidetes bacterium GWF2_41_31]